MPVLAGAGREQRDELVSEVEERAAVRALDRTDVEQPRIERDRGLDVIDLERHVVDADHARETSVLSHTATVGAARAEFQATLVLGPKPM